jgi:hypothetical protein
MQFITNQTLHEVNIKEWQPGKDEKLFVTELTGAEHAELEHIRHTFFSGTDEERRLAYAKIAVRFAKKADRTPFFSPLDIEKVASGSNKPLRRIYAKLTEINELDDAAAEELEKN